MRRHQGGRATDVDHLDRLVDPDELRPDGWCERLHIHDHEVDGGETLRLEVVHLLLDVAAREDPGVDGVMERLDLAAQCRATVGQVIDGADVDALAGEELSRPVGREHLDVERSEFPRERRDPLPIRD